MTAFLRGGGFVRRSGIGMPGVADYWLVETARGPDWVPSKSRRQQSGWDAHAAFMDGLVEDGFVVLSGPAGELDGDEALLVFEAQDEDEVRTRWRMIRGSTAY